MSARPLAALLLPAALLLAGCRGGPDLPAKHQPTTLYGLEDSLYKGTAKDPYAARWKAATLCLEVVDDPRSSTREKLSYARRALKHCDKAIELDPKRVEGHFYRAVSVGRVLDNEGLPDLDRIKEIEASGKRARAIDPAFRCSGPLRLLGLLYQKAPPLVSGLDLAGDEEVVEELFREAIRRSPECPQNYVCLAELLKEVDQPAEALKQARKAKALLGGAHARHLSELDRRDLELRLHTLFEALKS